MSGFPQIILFFFHLIASFMSGFPQIILFLVVMIILLEPMA
jgi:hypothetical protein